MDQRTTTKTTTIATKTTITTLTTKQQQQQITQIMYSPTGISNLLLKSVRLSVFLSAWTAGVCGMAHSNYSNSKLMETACVTRRALSKRIAMSRHLLYTTRAPAACERDQRPTIRSCCGKRRPADLQLCAKLPPAITYFTYAGSVYVWTEMDMRGDDRRFDGKLHTYGTT